MSVSSHLRFCPSLRSDDTTGRVSDLKGLLFSSMVPAVRNMVAEGVTCDLCASSRKEGEPSHHRVQIGPLRVRKTGPGGARLQRENV
jgi:hypothetical protein